MLDLFVTLSCDYHVLQCDNDVSLLLIIIIYKKLLVCSSKFFSRFFIFFYQNQTSIWLKYCRRGVNHQPTNQSINQNQTGFNEDVNFPAVVFCFDLNM